MGIGGEISVDQFLGFGAGYSQTLRQTEGRDAVDDTEVGRLGVAALVVSDLFERNTIDFRCRDAVYVIA